MTRTENAYEPPGTDSHDRMDRPKKPLPGARLIFD